MVHGCRIRIRIQTEFRKRKCMQAHLQGASPGAGIHPRGGVNIYVLYSTGGISSSQETQQFIAQKSLAINQVTPLIKELI